MHELYPLKFNPVFDDRIWGGQKIRTRLGIDFSPMERCAEAWTLSGYEGRQTTVSNGFLAGNELNELVEVYMDDLVGGKVYDTNGDTFPLLVKFIDASQWLSIQVHPDDEIARKQGLPNGKSEMWYVIEAEEGSELISGFKKKVTHKTFLELLESGKLPEILNYEKVKTGDVFFIPAGRVHSLGPGILLTEIQQTSDATYRIFDWDRTDDQGNRRELHIDKAIQSIDFEVYPEYKTHYSNRLNETCELVASPYFNTNLLEVAQPLQKNYEELDSYVVYICLEGKTGILYSDGKVESLRKGEVLLIPASLEFIGLVPETTSKILEVYSV